MEWSYKLIIKGLEKRKHVTKGDGESTENEQYETSEERTKSLSGWWICVTDWQSVRGIIIVDRLRDWLTEECEVWGGVADELDERLAHGLREGPPGGDDVADAEHGEQEPHAAHLQALGCK